jgi:hypothetical protein
MTFRSALWSAAALCLLGSPALADDEDFELVSAEEFGVVEDDGAEIASYNRVHYDSNVRPVQASSGSSRSTAASSRSSRVPYMIGDQFGDGIGSIELTSIYPSAYYYHYDTEERLISVERPAIGGNRLNVAEANTAMPTDRVLFSYRHLSNAVSSNIFDQRTSLNLDQWTVGFENTFSDSLGSIALQVPVYYQADSDLEIVSTTSGSNAAIIDREWEAGDVGLILKILLIGRSSCAVSGGMALKCPTADDTSFTGRFNNGFPLIGQGAVSADPTSTLFFHGEVENHTFNAVPFMAWSANSLSGCFTQGFVQCDVPLNASPATLSASGTIDPDSTFDPQTFDVEQSARLREQILMRVNLGFGYWLCEGGRNDMVRGVAAISEVHYTTAVGSSGDALVPLAVFNDPSLSGDSFALAARAGRDDANIDIVNLSTGLAVDMGSCLITNGIVVPVSGDDDRAFDCEYNLQVNLRY